MAVLVVAELVARREWLLSGKRYRGEAGIRATDLSAPLRQLAEDVRRKLMDAERRHRLNRPAPMRVRWVNADPAIAGNWGIIRGGQDLSPIDLSDHPSLLEAFDAVPSGQLVVLGAAGAGKTAQGCCVVD